MGAFSCVLHTFFRARALFCVVVYAVSLSIRLVRGGLRLLFFSGFEKVMGHMQAVPFFGRWIRAHDAPHAAASMRYTNLHESQHVQQLPAPAGGAAEHRDLFPTAHTLSASAGGGPLSCRGPAGAARRRAGEERCTHTRVHSHARSRARALTHTL